MSLSRLARKVDTSFRFDDLKSQGIGPSGHTEDSHFYFGFVVWAMLAGMPESSPSRWTSAAAAAIVMLAYARLRVSFKLRERPPWITLAAQLLFLASVGVPVFLFASPTTSWPFYNNVFVPAIGVAAASLVISAFAARALFQPLRADSKYRIYLDQTELFQGREFRRARGWTLFWQCVASLIGNPVRLFLPAALVSLISPEWLLYYAAGAMFSVTAIYRICAGIEPRLDVIGEVYLGRFLHGASVLVSIISIVLAAARLAGVSYVTTVFDSSSGFTIATFFAFIYTAAWWFEYWVDRLLGQELMQLVDASASVKTAIPYPYNGPEITNVPNDNRELRLHGMGRFLAFRAGDNQRFHTWSHAEFFSALAFSGAPGGKARPQPQLIAQRIVQFRVIVTIVTIAAFGGSAWWLSKLPQDAELAVGENSKQSLRLADLIRQDNGGKPFVMVAASGGGTRAALFTGVVLEALHPIGRKRFVAGSGVSGGAAALAIYAAKGSPMTGHTIRPYIRDVIQRSIEWRIIKGGRMGTLLAESFERGWHTNTRFEQVNDFGLIFNTTLAGHFRRLPGETGTLADISAEHFSRTSSQRAGDRLLLTNLDLSSAFVAGQTPVLVTNGSTPLTHAAALSANFPPVFANAAIDVADNDRYWVTDGGAADNTGLEMLLYAVRDALRGWPDALPKIHIVVIDASGISEGYSQTRGIDSAIGSGAQFAKYLHAELMRDLREKYAKQPEDFQVTEIHMPRFLREPGAIGTHWMMQPRTHLRIDGATRTFNDLDLAFAIRSAYINTESKAPQDLIRAIRESPEFKNTWPALLRAIL